MPHNATEFPLQEIAGLTTGLFHLGRFRYLEDHPMKSLKDPVGVVGPLPNGRTPRVQLIDGGDPILNYLVPKWGDPILQKYPS